MSSSPEHNPLNYSPNERALDWELNTDTRDRVQAGVDRFGEAPFSAFLTLPDVDLHDSRLLELFEDRYAGSYDSMQHLADRWLSAASWQMGLVEYVTVSADNPRRLTIDYKTIETDIRKGFALIELDNNIHVFTKP